MRTDQGEQDPWVTMLEHDVLWLEGPGGLRVMEVLVKVRHSGLLAVVKVRKGGDSLIGFKGGKGLRSLSGKIRTMIMSEDTNWRLDQYA